MPPGLANKDNDDGQDDHDILNFQTYTLGHTLPGDYVILFDPVLYPLWPQALLVRSDDFLYLIDPLSGAILQNSGPVADWNWGWSDVDFAHCPPGLAKKNPPCIPPGQARKGVHADPYHPGDHLPAGYSVLLTPQQDPASSVYARLGDQLYRVDRQTGEVQELIGLISSLLH